MPKEEVPFDEKIVPALPAASVLLLRDGPPGLQVLMMRRALTMKFAPGAFVFPGGKVDNQDHKYGFWNQFLSGCDSNDLSFKIAVLRELYEEVGVLYNEDQPSKAHLGARNFKAAVSASQTLLRDDLLLPFAHWITPIAMKRRFDTKFYLAPISSDCHARHDGNEAISMKWVSPRRIIANWKKGKVPLMFPTRLNLEKLAEASTVNEAMKNALKSHVKTVMPSVTRQDGSIEVTIPKSAGYTATKATLRELSVEGGARSTPKPIYKG